MKQILLAYYGIPNVLVTAIMTLYEGTKAKVMLIFKLECYRAIR